MPIFTPTERVFIAKHGFSLGDIYDGRGEGKGWREYQAPTFRPTSFDWLIIRVNARAAQPDNDQFQSATPPLSAEQQRAVKAQVLRSVRERLLANGPRKTWDPKLSRYACQTRNHAMWGDRTHEPRWARGPTGTLGLQGLVSARPRR